MAHLTRVAQHEVRALNSGAHAVVRPSRSEGFDLSGVEAMLCDTLVIASDIQVHRWVYGDAASYFDTYDVGSCADAIVRALSSSKDTGYFGGAALPGSAARGAVLSGGNSPQWADMNNIPNSYAGNFDFTWSSCALEHLGSISNGLRFIEESMKCVKAGGVAVHTTEWNFTSEHETVDNQGTVLFLRRHFEDLARRLVGSGYEVKPLDFSLGSGLLDKFIDIPPYESHQEAHLRLTIDGFGATSFGVIVSKPSWSSR